MDQNFSKALRACKGSLFNKADGFVSLSNMIKDKTQNIDWEDVKKAAAVKRGCDYAVVNEESKQAFNKSRLICGRFKQFIQNAGQGLISESNANDVSMANILTPLIESDLTEIRTGASIRNKKTNMFCAPTFVVVDNGHVTAVDVYKNEYPYGHGIKAAFFKDLGVDYKVFSYDKDNNIEYELIEPDYGKYNDLINMPYLFKNTDHFKEVYGLK